MASPNLVTKSQKCKITWFIRKDKSQGFHWKRSVVVLECRLQTNLAAKTTWSESLICRTIILQQFKVKDSIRNAITEGPRGKSDRAVSSCCETERVKMTSFWEKSREIWSSNYSRGPYSNVWSSWPTTRYHNSISWPVRSTNNRLPSSKQQEEF